MINIAVSLPVRTENTLSSQCIAETATPTHLPRGKDEVVPVLN
jgi:hypothetical protein